MANTNTKTAPRSTKIKESFGSRLFDVVDVLIICLLLACVLILVFFLGNKVVWKKLGFFGALVMLAVVVMANVFAWTQHQELNARSGAVVMSSSVVVKSTPNESGTDLFVLHEGTRVEIIDDSMKEWKEIRLADGKVGWMPTEAMEVI